MCVVLHRYCHTDNDTSLMIHTDSSIGIRIQSLNQNQILNRNIELEEKDYHTSIISFYE